MRTLRVAPGLRAGSLAHALALASALAACAPPQSTPAEAQPSRYLVQLASPPRSAGGAPPGWGPSERT
ncbi:MAG: hypothetical protein QM765_10985 [Myxococcales bacterium]